MEVIEEVYPEMEARIMLKKGAKFVRTGRRRRDGGHIFRWAGSAVAVTMIVLFAPLGAAIAVPGNLKAPYTGTVTTSYNQFSAGGCAAAKMLKNASFDPLTGRGYFGAHVSAKPCAQQFAGIGTTSDGSATGVYTIAVPLAVGGNGYYHIKLVWSTNFSSNMTYNPGTCTGSAQYYGCSSYAYWNAFVSIGLFDSSNGSGVPFTGPGCWNGGCGTYQWDAYRVYSNNTDCGVSYGGCALSGSSSTFGILPTHLSYYLNTSWPLLTNQSYSIIVEAGVQEYAAVGAYGGAKVTGAISAITFNGGTLGNYQRLLYMSWR